MGGGGGERGGGGRGGGMGGGGGGGEREGLVNTQAGMDRYIIKISLNITEIHRNFANNYAPTFVEIN